MNNIEFVAAAQKLKDEKYGYIWGAKGEVATESLLQRCIRAAKTAGTYTFTDAKIAYARQKLIAAGTRVVDCSGLLTVSAGLSARGSAQIWADCQSKSSEIKDIPNTTGLVVYRPGHIGIYLGSGKVIESGGYSVGVTVTPIAQPATGKAWTGYGKWKQIEYVSQDTAAASGWTAGRVLKLTSPIQTGEDVKGLQTALASAGYPCGAIDGKLGKQTDAAIRAYQSATGLTVDGKAGKQTITALGGSWTGK